MLANGFGTLCDKFEYPYYLLTRTYRLLPKSASLTSIFYNKPLVSMNMESKYNSNLSYLDKEGWYLFAVSTDSCWGESGFE